MQKQSRSVLCVNCDNWHVAHNVEQGTCKLEQDGEIMETPTNYDTRCLYGIVNYTTPPEIETKTKTKPKIIDDEELCDKCGGAGWLWGREIDNADEDIYNDDATHYTCDECDGNDLKSVTTRCPHCDSAIGIPRKPAGSKHPCPLCYEDLDITEDGDVNWYYDNTSTSGDDENDTSGTQYDKDGLVKYKLQPIDYGDNTCQEFADELVLLKHAILKLKSYEIKHDDSCMKGALSHFEDRAGNKVASAKYDEHYHKKVYNEICTCGLEDLLKKD